MKVLLTEVVAIPGRPRGKIMENAAIGWDTDDGLITEVGQVSAIDPKGYDEVVARPGHLVIPGLVNGHGHAVQSLYKGTQERRPLELWRQYIKARDRCVDGDDMRVATALASVELLHSGCTTTIEHHYSAVDEPHMGALHVLKAWEQVGIRGVYAAMVSDIPYDQTVGIDSSTLDDAARDEVAQISTSERAETVAQAREFIESNHNRSELVTFLFGPSAPHRCSDQMITAVARTAAELGIGWHMHVGETIPQRRRTLEAFGVTPVGRLAQLGVLSPHVSIAHGVWLDDGDLDAIADAGTTVVHNPASNLKLGSGIAPIPNMLARGIHVALGTDGAASNDSQSMFEAMKLAATLQGGANETFTHWPSAWEVFEMATMGGARALGLDDVVGSLEPGKAADVVVLGRTPALVPLNDPLLQLVYGPAAGAVRDVIIAGRPVMRGGTMVTLDQDALFDEVEQRVSARRPAFEAAVTGVAALEPTLARLYLEDR